jgi:hypothetical protein
MFDPESKKKAAAAAAAASAAASAKAEKEAPVEEAPSKIEVAEINLNILCNVSYLDFEGMFFFAPSSFTDFVCEQEKVTDVPFGMRFRC